MSLTDFFEKRQVNILEAIIAPKAVRKKYAEEGIEDSYWSLDWKQRFRVWWAGQKAIAEIGGYEGLLERLESGDSEGFLSDDAEKPGLIDIAEQAYAVIRRANRYGISSFTISGVPATEEKPEIPPEDINFDLTTVLAAFGEGTGAIGKKYQNDIKNKKKNRSELELLGQARTYHSYFQDALETTRKRTDESKNPLDDTLRAGIVAAMETAIAGYVTETTEAIVKTYESFIQILKGVEQDGLVVSTDDKGNLLYTQNDVARTNQWMFETLGIYKEDVRDYDGLIERFKQAYQGAISFQTGQRIVDLITQAFDNQLSAERRDGDIMYAFFRQDGSKLLIDVLNFDAIGRYEPFNRERRDGQRDLLKQNPYDVSQVLTTVEIDLPHAGEVLTRAVEAYLDIYERGDSRLPQPVEAVNGNPLLGTAHFIYEKHIRPIMETPSMGRPVYDTHIGEATRLATEYGLLGRLQEPFQQISTMYDERQRVLMRAKNPTT